MKFIVVLLGLLAIGSASPRVDPRLQKSLYETAQRIEIDLGFIEDLINKALAVLAEKDPLDVPESNLEILEYYYKIQNLKAQGFSNIIVDLSLNVGIPTVKFSLSVHHPESSGSVEVWENNIPIIFGKGSGSYSLKNVQVNLDISYSLFGGFSTTYKSTIEDSSFSVTGIQNDEELSQKITDHVNHLLTVVANDPAVDQAIADFINGLLTGMVALEQ